MPSLKRKGAFAYEKELRFDQYRNADYGKNFGKKIKDFLIENYQNI